MFAEVLFGSVLQGIFPNREPEPNGRGTTGRTENRCLSITTSWNWRMQTVHVTRDRELNKIILTISDLGTFMVKIFSAPFPFLKQIFDHQNF
jgi:hypothetical protein